MFDGFPKLHQWRRARRGGSTVNYQSSVGLLEDPSQGETTYICIYIYAFSIGMRAWDNRGSFSFPVKGNTVETIW